MSALIRMSAGLLVWTVAFCLLYGLHGIGCTAGWPMATVAGVSLHRTLLAAAWAGCLIAGGLTVFALRHQRAAASLVDRTAWRIALVGLAATVITGLPILLLPSCL